MSGTDSGLWYVRTQGKVSGPFSLDALRIERDRERLGPACELSTDRRDWQPAGSFPELFPSPTFHPGPSVTQWYFMGNGQRHGPMSLAPLQRAVAIGQCSSQDLVWHRGLPDWTPCYLVPELAASRPPKPARQAFGGKTQAAIVAVACLVLIVPPSLVLVLKSRSPSAKRPVHEDNKSRDALVRAEAGPTGGDVRESSVPATGGRVTPPSAPSPNHPVDRLIPKDEFLKAAAVIRPETRTTYCFGTIAKVGALTWVELVLHVQEEHVTDNEYQALIDYVFQQYFAPGSLFAGAPVAQDFGESEDPAASRAQADRVMAGYVNNYTQVVGEKLRNPATFPNQKKPSYVSALNDAARAREHGYPVTMNQVLAELARYRAEGPRALSGASDITASPAGNHPKGVSVFQFGDKVCNNGVLLLWTGTIVDVNGKSYTIRIDYVSDIPFVGKSYELNKPYPFVEGEFKHKTANSIDSFFRDR
jgi:GYF domain 2